MSGRRAVLSQIIAGCTAVCLVCAPVYAAQDGDVPESAADTSGEVISGEAVTEQVSDLSYEKNQIIVTYAEPVRYEVRNGWTDDTASDTALEWESVESGSDAVVQAVNGVLDGHSASLASVDAVDTESRIQLLSFTEPVDVPGLVAEVSALDGVVSAQPNFIYELHLSNDPAFRAFSSKTWPFTFLEMEEVYNEMPPASYRAPASPVIGIVDGNIKTSHPDLKNVLWSPTQCVDDAGNIISGGCPKGGFSREKSRTSEGVWDGTWTINSDPELGFGTHGTRVAGVALAEYNNRKGAAGIARNAKLMSLAAPVDPGFPIDIDKVGTVTAKRMIDVARRNGADVLNLSWGLTYPSGSVTALSCGGADDDNNGSISEQEILRDKVASGFDQVMYDAIRSFPGIVTIAAGNSSKPIGTGTAWSIPADYTKTVYDTATGDLIPGPPERGSKCWDALENVIAVGGITSSNVPYSETNYGPHIELLAPAQSILTTSYRPEYTAPSSSPTVTPVSSWQTGADSDGSYISPIPADGNAAVASSVTIGPFDLSDLSRNRDANVQVTFKHLCPSEYGNLLYGYSADGTSYSTISAPTGGNQARSADIFSTRYFTENFHIKLSWSGTGTAGLTKEDCKVYLQNMVNFEGPLLDNLTFSQEFAAGYYASVTGTSMAAPIVAGAVAVLLEVKPTLTVTKIREILNAGAGEIRGSSFTLGGRSVSKSNVAAAGRRLNIRGALQELRRQEPTLWPQRAPGLPALSSASDAGADDDVTNLTSLTFTGTAEYGASVTLTASRAGYTVSGTATADVVDGTYSIALDLATATDSASTTIPSGDREGAWTVTARQQETGRTGLSDPSEVLTVTVDTTGPRIGRGRIGTGLTAQYRAHAIEKGATARTRDAVASTGCKDNTDTAGAGWTDYDSTAVSADDTVGRCFVFADATGNTRALHISDTNTLPPYFNPDISGDFFANATDAIVHYLYEVNKSQEDTGQAAITPFLAQGVSTVTVWAGLQGNAASRDFSGDSSTNSTDAIVHYLYEVSKSQESVGSAAMQSFLSSGRTGAQVYADFRIYTGR